jgi:parallel beta-helix repeat protein
MDLIKIYQGVSYEMERILKQILSQMPNIPSALIKVIIICLSLSCLFLAENTQAAYYIDNRASGCGNGDTSYNPSNRTCYGGSDTIFTSWRNAVNGVPAGSPGNPTVINIRSGSTYTMSSLINITKAWTKWQKYSRDSAKPHFDWAWSWNDAWAWQGLININASGVTIDGIEIGRGGYKSGSYKSMAAGIQISGSTHSAPQYTNITVKNCYIHHIGNSGIEFFRASNVVIQDNELYEVQYSRTVEGGDYWFAAISSSFNTDNVTISGNHIHGCGGEGLNLNRWASNYTIENNTVYDCAMPAIFINGMKHTVVRNNLVYHTGNPRFLGYSAGIMVAAEWYFVNSHVYNDSEDVDVYDNMIAGTTQPLSIAEVTTRYGYKVKNTRIYNNTIIEPRTNRHSFYVSSAAAVGDGVVVKNNIFWQDISSAAIASVPYSSGIVFKENLWSKAPTREAQDTSDPRYSAYTSLNKSDYFQKSSGWDNIAPGSLKRSDFYLLPSSATYAYSASGDVKLGYSGSNAALIIPSLTPPTLSIVN